MISSLSKSFVVILLVCLAGGRPSQAAEPADEPGSTRKKEVFAEFRQAANDYAIALDGETERLELHPRSLFNWSNPVRLQEQGSVFVWLKDGRPQVAGSIFTYGRASDARKVKHELQSLSSSPLTARYAGTLAWKPRNPGIRWLPLKDAPRPRDDERGRLIQMRGIARQFGVTLTSPRDEKTRLRLAPQPLFRYSSKRAQVLDGAIFSFVVATDPEAILLVEAAGEPGSETWRYAFARFHYWNLEAADASGEVVWSAEQDLTHVNNPIGNSTTIEKTYNSFQP